MARGASEHLRDVSGRDALFPQLAGLGGVGVVDLAWASALAPVGCRSGQPGAGPHIVDRADSPSGQPVGGSGGVVAGGGGHVGQCAN